MSGDEWDGFIAEKLQDYETMMGNAVARRDAEVAAYAGKRLAFFRGRETDRLAKLKHWPTQSWVAQALGVSRARVSTLVREEKLKTNGRTRKACRINPQSLVRYVLESRATINNRDSHRASVLMNLLGQIGGVDS